MIYSAKEIPSVADSVAQSYLKTKSSDQKRRLQPVFNELMAGCKRISYDQAVYDLAKGTEEHSDPEDIAGMYKHIGLPFERLWVEGRTPLLSGHGPYKHSITGEILSADPFRARIGALIYADYKKREWSFQFVKEMVNAKAMLADYHGELPASARAHALNDRIYVSYPVQPTISFENGIELDEDKLLNQIDKMSKHKKLLKINPDYAAIIDQYYFAADFLARLFVVYSARNTLSKLSALNHGDKKLIKGNRNRVKKSKRPLLPVHPIQIDVTEFRKIAKAKTTQELKKALGHEIDVARSRPIVSKYGVVFTRKAHKRRVATAQDHRQAGREITAKNSDAKIIIKNARPEFVKKSSQNPFSKPNGLT